MARNLLSHRAFRSGFFGDDPIAPDRNFTIVGDRPYLYDVHLNSNNSDRVLIRQPIRLNSNQ